FRLKWERHTEFTRYTFMCEESRSAPFRTIAIKHVPEDWLVALPGQIIVDAHAAYVLESDDARYDAIGQRYFGDKPIVGASVGGKAATALTDFHIQDDGFSRWLLLGGGMRPMQAGRTMQRLLEIDTYRLMALLALPVARDLAPFLAENERELASITNAISDADVAEETNILDRLTRMEAAIEGRYVDNHYRFSAATAYYDLVKRRIGELREERISGLQTFREFTERRLAPAMNTCVAAASRQEALSRRVSRASQLLATRVSISQQGQNQALLESMDQRARLQLRLQQTVEGLSVAAITYYVVGLINYLTKGINSFGIAANANLIVAISIPVVLFAIAFGVRHIRRRVTDAKDRSA
ncbi:MAG: DUF3422 domain-containing protein, partial [Rhodospirillaceae bacterium]|nr:DUF3422 domain-containing protein [Rhodospirillaceae bacterium]